jgi:hypothetical protein
MRVLDTNIFLCEILCDTVVYVNIIYVNTVVLYAVLELGGCSYVVSYFYCIPACLIGTYQS